MGGFDGDVGRLAELARVTAELRAHLTRRGGGYFSAAQRAAITAEAQACARPGGGASCGALENSCFKNESAFYNILLGEAHNA